MGVTAGVHCCSDSKLESESLAVVDEVPVYGIEKYPQKVVNGVGNNLKTKVAKPRHLVLNMDVNKTVVMTDAVSGKTTDMVVNGELSNAVWGVISDGKWTPVVDVPTCERPRLESGETLHSYTEFVATLYPKDKKKRTELNSDFTKPGHPGESFAHYAETMRKELILPNGEDCKLIPSFLDLLVHLKQSARSFTICFRTFGEDLPSVCEDFNKFCEGRHPLYPNIRMDGSDGSTDYRFSVADGSQTCGTFHRDDSTLSLVLGTIEQAGEGQFKNVKDATLDFYDRFPNKTVIKGFHPVQNFLWGQYKNGAGTLALRDTFQYWKSKKQTTAGGKPFFFDPAIGSNQHELFFDDNIDFDDCYIVQPISVHDLDRVHWATFLLQTHMCRVEPLEAIPDRSYFVERLRVLEAAYDRKLQVREKLRRVIWAVKEKAKAGELSLDRMVQDKEEHYDAWKDRRKAARNVLAGDKGSAENLVIDDMCMERTASAAKAAAELVAKQNAKAHAYRSRSLDLDRER